MARRSITISEDFGIWRVEVTNRPDCESLKLVDALVKAAITSPAPLSRAVDGTHLSITAACLEALLPNVVVREDGPEAS